MEKTKKKTKKLIGMDRQKKALYAAMEKGKPALLIGSAGTGKTSLAESIANEMHRPYYRVNLNGYVTPDMLVGRPQARGEKGSGTTTFFQYGIIPKALREGAVLILDEINAALPDTLFVLHPLLESEPRLFIPETEEEILPQDGFTVIATMNPSHEYAGTRGLNAALYSRFSIVLRFETLQGEALCEALRANVESAKDDAVVEVAEILESCEAARREEKINTLITLREGIAALDFLKWLSKKEALEAAIYSKLEDYERQFIKAPKIIMKDNRALSQIFERADLADLLEKKLAKAENELKELQDLKNVVDCIASAKAQNQ